MTEGQMFRVDQSLFIGTTNNGQTVDTDIPQWPEQVTGEI